MPLLRGSAATAAPASPRSGTACVQSLQMGERPRGGGSARRSQDRRGGWGGERPAAGILRRSEEGRTFPEAEPAEGTPSRIEGAGEALCPLPS